MVYRLSPSTRADLTEIWKYIVRQSGSEAVARRLLHDLDEAFQLLDGNPLIGRTRHDDLGVGRRSFPSGDYVILYRVDRYGVRILRVIHGSRDIAAHFRPD